MESSVKQNLIKYSAINLLSWAVYLFALVGWLQFSEAYFSASTPSWAHYLLGIFLFFAPFIVYFSIKQIRRNGKVNYLYAFSPVVWLLLTLTVVWLTAVVV